MIIFLVLFASASALTFGPECQDNNFIIDCADLIVEGFPINKTPFFDDKGRVLTSIDFDITDTWKGEKFDGIEIRQIGGVLGENKTKVIGVTYNYTLGNRYKLFLEKSKKGDYYLVCCGEQGIIEMEKELYIRPSHKEFEEVRPSNNIFVKFWNWILSLFR